MLLSTFVGLKSLTLSAQISDLRGGGAHTLSSSRFYNNVDGLASIFGNVAAMGASKTKLYLNAGAQSRHRDEALGEYNLTAAKSFNNQAIGFNFVQIGTSGYYERRMQLAYGRQLFEAFYVGTNLNGYQIQITEYGKRITPTVDLFTHSTINNLVTLSLSARNIVAPKSSDISYPQTISVALGYNPSPSVFFGVEGSKVIDRPSDVRLLIKYSPSDDINFVLGSNVLHQQIALGFTYGFGMQRIGVAYGYTNLISPSYGLSLDYVK